MESTSKLVYIKASMLKEKGTTQHKQIATECRFLKNSHLNFQQKEKGLSSFA